MNGEGLDEEIPVDGEDEEVSTNWEGSDEEVPVDEDDSDDEVIMDEEGSEYAENTRFFSVLCIFAYFGVKSGR